MAVRTKTDLETETHPQQTTAARQEGFPASSTRFDLVMTLLAGWFLIGLFVDGAAHNHGAVDNTFFTPWHALLYSGVAALGAALVYTHYRNVGRGYSWAQALPEGYRLSLAGVLLFMLGGGFDMWWHSAFGFEANIEALISPAHLILGSAACLFLTGPLRSAWRRLPYSTGWRDLMPTVLSTLLLFSLLTFFTMYGNPLAQPDEFSRPIHSSAWNIAAVSGILILAALMMGCLLPVMRRWRLPFGSLALILGLNAVLMFALRYNFLQSYWLLVAGVFLVGLTGDALVYRLQPSSQQPGMMRFFAFVLPVLYFMVYFVILAKVGQVTWTVHMWLGVTFMTGIVGLALSFLVFPPDVSYPLPDEHPPAAN